MRKLLITLTVGLALTIGASQASAEDLDLTFVDASGDIIGLGGTALLNQGEPGSGTGMFPAFTQIAPTGNSTSSQAYNTTVNMTTQDGGTNDNGTSDVHNHEIQVSDLPTFLVGGVLYYGFVLDINENSGGTPDNSGVSLDQIIVITSTTANQSSEPLPSGTTRWSMDGEGGGTANDTIYLAFDEGSGKADMTLLVPVTAFGTALQTDFVYLFSAFGGAGSVNPPGTAPLLNYGQSDGFEEWALPFGGTVVTPDGGATAALLGLSMLGLRFLSRRKKQ